jgi:hypothetical protein
MGGRTRKGEALSVMAGLQKMAANALLWLALVDRTSSHRRWAQLSECLPIEVAADLDRGRTGKDDLFSQSLE